jgi:N-acetylmuramoyl-L-alanine amidase
MAQVLSRQGHKDRGIKQSQFYVLLHTEAPAALLEYEFISNEKQALWLSTYDTICLLARATIDGIRDAVHRMDGSS